MYSDTFKPTGLPHFLFPNDAPNWSDVDTAMQTLNELIKDLQDAGTASGQQITAINNAISSINSTLKTLNDQITTVSDAEVEDRDNINKNAGNITKLQNDFSNAEQEITALQNSVQANAQDITALQSSVSTNTNNISKLMKNLTLTSISYGYASTTRGTSTTTVVASVDSGDYPTSGIIGLVNFYLRSTDNIAYSGSAFVALIDSVEVEVANPTSVKCYNLVNENIPAKDFYLNGSTGVFFNVNKTSSTTGGYVYAVILGGGNPQGEFVEIKATVTLLGVN